MLACSCAVVAMWLGCDQRNHHATLMAWGCRPWPAAPPPGRMSAATLLSLEALVQSLCQPSLSAARPLVPESHTLWTLSPPTRPRPAGEPQPPWQPASRHGAPCRLSGRQPRQPGGCCLLAAPGSGSCGGGGSAGRESSFTLAEPQAHLCPSLLCSHGACRCHCPRLTFHCHHQRPA